MDNGELIMVFARVLTPDNAKRFMRGVSAGESD
jgi:hypothetical protein